MLKSLLKYLGNNLTSADKVLIAILIGISSLSWLWIDYFNVPGVWVQVWIENQESGHFSIKTDQIITVQGPLGETRFQIKDNRVTIIESPCPNKICCQMGEIHRSGQILVCVPNRVVLKIVGESGPVAWDVITE